MSHRKSVKHHPQQLQQQHSQGSVGHQTQQISPKVKNNPEEEDSELAHSHVHSMGYYHGVSTEPETPKYVRESLLLSNRKILNILNT